LYRLLTTLALPLLVLQVLIWQMHGRLPRGALRERLGLGPARGGGATAAPAIWLHGASNGELTSARWIIEQLRAQLPGLQLLVTSNSATGRKMVENWQMAGVTAALAPFDAGRATGRVLARWRPSALIIVENELWPGRISAAHKAGVPVMVVGARLSARSAGRWQRFAPGMMRRLLEGLDFVSAQDGGSEARLVGLGLPNDRLGPRLSLKAQGRNAAAAPPPFDPPAPRSLCLLAASTHAGEDAPILDAFIAARNAGMFRHLILAPRHPRRAGDITALIAERGLTVAQRSLGEVPGAASSVYLADTMGEMDHWFAMAGVTVLGGTFAEVGGHTPWEPVIHGSALVHGPSVFNNAEAFAALDASGGTIALSDIGQLRDALLRLDECEQGRLAELAQRAERPTANADVLIAALRERIG
jgi:3-deoxy-D-manno-octulosonic-acid transferase